jgi:hypothetical protein
MERLTLLVVPRRGPVSFVVPRLEATEGRSHSARAPAAQSRSSPFEETDDAAALVADLAALGLGGRGGRRPGADRSLRPALGDARPAAAAACPAESSNPRAPSCATCARSRTPTRRACCGSPRPRPTGPSTRSPPGPRRPNRSRRQPRDPRRLVDEGHDLADFAIVGSGPNGASPHHDAGDRRIQAGEPVVLDIGGTLAGYCSDTTRTDLGRRRQGIEPDPEFRACLRPGARGAGEAATAAVRPGVPAASIDAAARRRYRGRRLRRVLHPSNRPRHRARGPRRPVHRRRQLHGARPGMAFSVEPGIYLPGRWGVRLENIVLCGDAAGEPLNRSSLALRVARA